LLSFIKYAIVASYQGGFRLVFMALLPFVFNHEDSNFIATEYSLFSALCLVLAVSPGVYVHRLIHKEVVIKNYTIVIVVFGLFVLSFINLLYELIELSPLLSLSFLVVFPIFVIQMIYRNLYIYMENTNRVIFIDVFFSFVFVLLFFVFKKKLIIDVPSFALVITSLCFLLCFYNQVLYKEFLKAIASGLSNFASGGMILILPFVLSKFEPSISYEVMVYVSSLSVLMLLPRVLLLKKTKKLVRSTRSVQAYNYLKLLRLKNSYVLMLSLFISFFVYILTVLVLKNIALLNVLIWIIVSLYFYYSQISLFDCNFIIYKGEVTKLLFANILVFLSFIIINLIIYFLLHNRLISLFYSELFSVLSLLLPIIVRSIYITGVVAEYGANNEE